MFSYLQQNLVLILGIAGAVISFLIFSLEKVALKQKLRLSLILATLGFLILTGQQVFTHLDKKNSDRLENARIAIVKEIRKKVIKAVTILEQLSKKLRGKSPEQVGVKLIQFIESAETNKLRQFFKGTPELWRKYDNWLQSFKVENRTREEEKAPCLSLIVNAEKHYRVGLLLAYLFTNPETNSYVAGVISRRTWGSFPDSVFIERYDFPEPVVKYVLFYDGSSGKLIGYADARLFAKELLLYKETGKTRLVEDVLNRAGLAYMTNMKKYFKTFKNNVAEQKDAYMVAKEMLERKINEMAVAYDGRLYLVNLSKIVKIVS